MASRLLISSSMSTGGLIEGHETAPVTSKLGIELCLQVFW
jgi:hypothetical protein